MTKHNPYDDLPPVTRDQAARTGNLLWHLLTDEVAAALPTNHAFLFTGWCYGDEASGERWVTLGKRCDPHGDAPYFCDTSGQMIYQPTHYAYVNVPDGVPAL
ncbi:hypothetical protein T2_00013 [Ralstonia phage Elie]|uniref:Uncharacterized protein n=4 Tax=Bakolyvirus TaxID=2843355 RepID=A0A7G5BBP2_9CAUD|nr:hypothetical protein KE332_gp13 [Ralstonia phage Adzire]YP_010052794.1 hypothetical protein KE333_gp45 [Ralstonia phage Bakoly]YP_010077700.1 hypothetical protein KMC38_gp13 [Ralstonia phage Simangalove]QMV32958.1 hypothetical protein T2_00013 [Ralstonia phage Elie]QMV33525.1 hypothetical protein 30B_00018 [Ralstonia phage Jenny]QMV33670.1 hypothetical protein S3_00026 [Ralstonia phage Sarlave]QMV32330.1 hypothetical protein S1_00013 [Ralstonia phage Adzire]QMV32618.1 hypothetical protein